MTDPHPDDWTPIRLAAHRFRFGRQDYHVRNMTTLADGSVTAEVAPPPDPAWEAYIDRVTGVTRSG